MDLDFHANNSIEDLVVQLEHPANDNCTFQMENIHSKLEMCFLLISVPFAVLLRCQEGS